jgi:hypothetical protein
MWSMCHANRSSNRMRQVESFSRNSYDLNRHARVASQPSARQLARRPKVANTLVLIVPPQTPATIRLRRQIREAFHDSKARTISASRR